MKSTLSIFLIGLILMPWQSILAGDLTLYYPDATGNPVVAVDVDVKFSNNGDSVDQITSTILWREHYQPYGEKLNNPVNEDIGYTGHEYDAETGLTYMQARYYDPKVGRFLAIDPVGFKPTQPMTFNRYSYANNNPYKYIDPNGEAAILRNPVFAGGAVLLAGYAVYKYQTDPAAKKAIDSLVASSNGKMSTAKATVLYVAAELLTPIIMNQVNDSENSNTQTSSDDNKKIHLISLVKSLMRRDYQRKK